MPAAGTGTPSHFTSHCVQSDFSETCSISSLLYSIRKISFIEIVSVKSVNKVINEVCTNWKWVFLLLWGCCCCFEGFFFNLRVQLLFTSFELKRGFNYMIRSCTLTVMVKQLGCWCKFTGKLHWWLHIPSFRQKSPEQIRKWKSYCKTWFRITGAKRSNPIFLSPRCITRPATWI